MGSFKFEFRNSSFLLAYPLIYSHGEWSPRQDKENVVRVDLDKVDTIRTENVANGGCDNSVLITFKDDGEEPIYFAFEAADEFREFLSEVDISFFKKVKVYPAFGPRNEKERAIFACENLRVDVQCAINELMVEKGISQEQLAALTGYSLSKIKAVFSDDCKLSVRKLGRIAHALGVECTISFKGKDQ